ncbi:MAG: methylenetetrahydrofolate--tRNA-(uracil(54)-C(5))-methyltransferase (FADH(2)-oxidizing) TrmFO [Gemmatimonadota bacterium]|nr:MAG: methylenetetrahydrofolate--tRNA-(uracil(54)-C(5))-methyltransferase (FADH(2)-oxidizing) TrmFO [Gemmatimonadota bacterium]
MPEIAVVGGGLAGAEAAWQLAERGHLVSLYEMRPVVTTPAHQTDGLAELVCSNSFKSDEPTNAHGLLKAELRELGSLLLRVAEETRVPAGAALAVDRRLFTQRIGGAIEAQPTIEVRREEVRVLPQPPAIVASGPLTSDRLFAATRRRLGSDNLYFYDAISPIVAADSIDETLAFRASRYGKGQDEAYINCPLNRDQYEAFYAALIGGAIYETHDWDRVPYFEGCLPIEVLAARDRDALRYGPLKPVGLRDPRTGKVPYAVVQLRQEDRAGRMWSLVGFQTRLRYAEQRRALQLIPALRNLDILRYGQIHRNSYINFPALLTPHGSPPDEPALVFAGQLTGVEGYIESAATGLLAAVNIDRLVRGLEPAVPPPTTMLGGLMRYLREADPSNFQPMNANFGLLDPLPRQVRGKRERRQKLALRGLRDMRAWFEGCEQAAARAGR